ncbi:MAG: hypothetical protein RMK91_04180 [Pseudanabaenaceae cyanobacterium SKYGB_i_bin29]|nr:hypothetical protein [Pseudanabaenaceae cyanobacterium SKYG29]MDW8421042.1 hypothetical protein [Pseudanabaenaceae cyanobacterium SKYGB_i_bin29]
MTQTTAAQPNSPQADTWQHLKDAIARSSGFERWWRMRYTEAELRQRRDEIIVAYLRETLDTLAY